MASLQKTYSGDLSTSIAKQLWIARNIAKAAKEDATDVAKAYGVDPMFGMGEFMSRALQMRATSRLPRRFQRQMPSVTMGDPSYLARGQSTPFASPVGPFKPTNAATMAKLAGQPFPNIAVGAPLSSQKSAPVPNIPKVPGIPRTNNTAPRQKGTVVRDQQLGNFLAAVALSLSASLNSMNKKLDESSEGISAAKDGIDNTYKKLEQHSDSLESKLDDIIDALRFSNRKEEEKRDKRQAETKIEQQKEEVDLSNSNRILMQDMDREEIRDLQRENIEDQVRDDQAGDQIPDPWEEPNTDELPSLAEGGIVSGPDSGYLAVLHGDEAVVPLDNNFTQGQPSAVGDQPISQMPMMAERGIMGDNPSTMKPSFTPNVSMASPTINIGQSSSSNMGEDLAKAIQLPLKAAGIVTMGLMGKALQETNLPPNVVAHLKSITAPIAGIFGVSDVLSGGLSEQMSSDYQRSQERQDVLSANRGREGRERGVLSKIKEFLFGTGGGYRGTGGNTYINNRTSGTGGGTKIAWGKKAFNPKYKSEVPSIKRRTMTTDQYSVEAGMLSPEAFEEKWNIPYETWRKLKDYPDQSSLNSPVFTKNVSYENAFDYKKFESPQYGLKTSEIAYNMSMQDEVNSIIEGLSDPDSQVILNNHTAKANSGKQIEQSAIAVRGNPLKEGTYLSPYSV